MRRFFHDTTNTQILNTYKKGDNLALTDAVYHHWCRVLRAKIGDQASLFDGFGGSYTVEIKEINKKQAIVELGAHTENDNTPNMYTQIGLVMSRGDRMDYAIQKATEMGVTSIQLLTSERGELRLKAAQIAKKLNHWQQVAIAACEQCGLNRIPIIIAPTDIKQWLEVTINSNGLVSYDDAVCEYINVILKDEFYQFLATPAQLSLILSVPKNKNINATESIITLFAKKADTSKPFVKLLVGPEGGFSVVEESESLKIGWQAWQIGSRVLRTETAPVVALSTLQTLQKVATIKNK